MDTEQIVWQMYLSTWPHKILSLGNNVKVKMWKCGSESVAVKVWKSNVFVNPAPQYCHLTTMWKWKCEIESVEVKVWKWKCGSESVKIKYICKPGPTILSLGNDKADSRNIILDLFCKLSSAHISGYCQDIVAILCWYFVSQIVLLSDFCLVSALRLSYYNQNKTSVANAQLKPQLPQEVLFALESVKFWKGFQLKVKVFKTLFLLYEGTFLSS